MEEKLRKLHLTSNEARAYLALLRFGRQSARDLAPRAGVSHGRVYSVLEAMIRKGFVTEVEGPSRSFVAVDPEIALHAVLEERRADLARTQVLCDELRDELAAVESETSSDVPAIEILGRPDQIAAHFEQLQDDAEREILVFNRPPYAYRTDNPAELRALDRGVRYAGLYEQDEFVDPEWVATVQTFLDHGEQTGIVPRLPLKMAIFDRETALLSLATSLDPAQPFTAVVVYDEGLVDALVIAFEHLQATAQSLDEFLEAQGIVAEPAT